MTEPVQLAKQTTDRLRSAITSSDSSSLTRTIDISNEYYRGFIRLTQESENVVITLTAAATMHNSTAMVNYKISQKELPITPSDTLMNMFSLNENVYYIGSSIQMLGSTRYNYTLSVKLTNGKLYPDVSFTNQSTTNYIDSFSITGILPCCSINS